MAVITPAIPIVGVALAWLLWGSRTLNPEALTAGRAMVALRRFFASHWALDWLFDRLLVRPYYALARASRIEIVDWSYMGAARLAASLHRLVAVTQTGQLRVYAVTMVTGLVILVALLSGVLT